MAIFPLLAPRASLPSPTRQTATALCANSGPLRTSEADDTGASPILRAPSLCPPLVNRLGKAFPGSLLVEYQSQPVREIATKQAFRNIQDFVRPRYGFLPRIDAASRR